MKRPNIVCIVNDHHAHYGHDNVMGPHIQRPNYEQFCNDGIRFNRAYSVCPLCGPARRSLLTGVYPHTHGETYCDARHPFDVSSYLETLSKAGYKNYYYGKWHAGPGEVFDHCCEGFSCISYGNPYITPEYKDYLKRHNLPEPVIEVEHNMTPVVSKKATTKEDEDTKKRFGDGEHDCLSWVRDMKEGAPSYQQKAYWCNETASGVMKGPKELHESFFLADLACEKLKEIAESKDDTPFTLRVDFWGPHQPYFPSEEFAAMYDPREIPEYPSFRENVYENAKPKTYAAGAFAHISENGKLIYPNPMPWSDWQEIIARDYAQITQLDAAAGLVLDALKKYGFDENTIVIWTADHGDALASHGGHFDKNAYLPEEVLRIPLAMRYPGVIPAHQVSNELVSNLDVGTTMLDAAGLKFDHRVDGISLLPLASGKTRHTRPYFVSEMHGHVTPAMVRAVISERYKYIFTREDQEELYDLCVDPHELTNRINDPDCQDILNELRQDLREWAVESHDEALQKALG